MVGVEGGGQSCPQTPVIPYDEKGCIWGFVLEKPGENLLSRFTSPNPCEYCVCDPGANRSDFNGSPRMDSYDPTRMDPCDPI